MRRERRRSLVALSSTNITPRAFKHIRTIATNITRSGPRGIFYEPHTPRSTR